MDMSTLQMNVQKVVTQRNIFLFFSVILSISVVTLSCLLFAKNERVVVIPTIGPSLWIEESRVSDTYLEKFGAYLADQFLSRSPADIDRKNKIILEYVHPSFYHAARKQLLQERDTMVKSNQTLLFRPSRSMIDPLKQTYILEGELLVFVGKQGETPSCAQREQKRFIFEFLCERGKLQLKSLKRENLTNV